MKKLIPYLYVLLLSLTSCVEDDDTYFKMPSFETKPAKAYKIIGNDVNFKTIEVGDGKLYIGGWSYNSSPDAHIDGDKIRKGDVKDGKIIAEIKGNQVFGKTANGKDFTATIDEDDIINGPSKNGYRLGYINHSSKDTLDITVGALGAVYFLYFTDKEYPHKNYTRILNAKTQTTYAIVENGKLFATKNGKEPIAFMEEDKVFYNNDVIVIQSGNQIIEPVSGGAIAIIDGNKVIRYNSVNNEILAIIDGDDPAAGALAVAALIINQDFRITSRITNNYSNTTIATIYLGSVLFEGNSDKGKQLAVLDGANIIKGDSKDGEIIAVIKDNQVIKGNSKDGKVIAEIKDSKIIITGTSGKQCTIGNIYDNVSIEAGALGAVYILLFDMPNSPTWVIDNYREYTKATIYEDKLYKGGSLYADPIAILDGNKIIHGSSKNGLTLATISENKVIKDGNVIAEIDENQITRVYPSGKKTVIGYFFGNESVNAGALGAVYFILLENNSPGSGSSGGTTETTKPTYIIRGGSSYGQAVATVYKNELIRGNSIYGKTVAVLNGNSIIAGSSKYGTTIAVINGNEVIKGSSKYGKTIAVINGNEIIEGSSKYGKTIGMIDGDGGTNAGALGAAYLLLLE